MERLRAIKVDGHEFELYRDEADEYYLLPAGSSQYRGPFNSESHAEDEAEQLAIVQNWRNAAKHRTGH